MTTARGGFTVKAYRGDAKTLLAFNLPEASARNLAGFTIQCQPAGQAPYYLLNTLRFASPEGHAHDDKEPAVSSINAPLHKFRWIHIPGSAHQGTRPFYGRYTYTVTPRYFDAGGALRPLDPALSASLAIEVGPFQTGALEVAFTRGFVQSQAFGNHFGKDAKIQPAGRELVFDTSQLAGRNAQGQQFTYDDMYEWLGFTARARLMTVLDDAVADRSVRVDMFAYDLNDPGVIGAILKLARQGRIRLILDNATLHHSTSKPTLEDGVEQAFRKAARKGAEILRGKFKRFSHDKVIIVSREGKPGRDGTPVFTPETVLTGSTNFSVTGLYVNANHVLVFREPAVAATYAEVFEAAWQTRVSQAKFIALPIASKIARFDSPRIPPTEVTFSPHTESFAKEGLERIVARIQREAETPGGSVLFAVMQLDQGSGPVFPALRTLHADQRVFSYGISDSPGGIQLYSPGKKSGVLVTGKPGQTKLPPPFNQVPSIGLGHQIHHKFVICGFQGDDPVVYCGSSNLAALGEQENGDNLIAIHDRDVATVFAIEALALVDHFEFLDRSATGPARSDPAKRRPPANKRDAAAQAGWFLSTSDRWTQPYFDRNDLHCVDRELFGAPTSG